ncbi:hypothetical protein ACIPPS_24260 [Streptomyces sp. NPDC090127]|uniref:hypothetical protein n=1 Tax=Streptomyces sp. NPDC090127 TaxID=3365953 RepID=UPI00382CEFB6
MHADVHLILHDLRAAELHGLATDTRAHTVPRNPVRAQLGWALVTLGLRLALPGRGSGTARPVTLAA